MSEETKTQPSCVLRLFGADVLAVRQAAGAFPPRWGLSAQCISRGGETLVALRAKKPAGLRKGEGSLRACFPSEFYGKGGEGWRQLWCTRWKSTIGCWSAPMPRLGRW